MMYSINARVSTNLDGYYISSTYISYRKIRNMNAHFSISNGDHLTYDYYYTFYRVFIPDFSIPDLSKRIHTRLIDPLSTPRIISP